MTDKLCGIWLHQRNKGVEISPMILRFTWSNDRFHSVEIEPPCSKHEVATALIRAARMIEDDQFI